MARKNVTAVECSRCHGVSYVADDNALSKEPAITVQLAGKHALSFDDLCPGCLTTVRKAVETLATPLEKKKRGPRKDKAVTAPPAPPPPPPPKAPRG